MCPDHTFPNRFQDVILLMVNLPLGGIPSFDGIPFSKSENRHELCSRVYMIFPNKIPSAGRYVFCWGESSKRWRSIFDWPRPILDWPGQSKIDLHLFIHACAQEEGDTQKDQKTPNENNMPGVLLLQTGGRSCCRVPKGNKQKDSNIQIPKNTIICFH